MVACLLVEQGFAHGSVRAQGARGLGRCGGDRVGHCELCRMVNWTLRKRSCISSSLLSSSSRGGLGLAAPGLVRAFPLPRAWTSSHAKLRLHDLRKERQVLGKQNVGFNFFQHPARAGHGYPRRRFKGPSSLNSVQGPLLTWLVVFATPAVPRQVI